ncbi:MAG: competence type IV pilus major pilin ComGC [Erysipelotrichaceae bacterium]|jgi:competence protein ComGC|nr:competence type IV pilus major pilin ComGC [Bacillota bacterium]NLP21875.1 prepilin-type N-terminal cleavage/methylation domain-containing protein [Erysipelotrichaceae bacterium]
MKKGFTLLEMIIVVSVLSILFLLAVPNIQKVIKIVDSKGCNALVKVVDSAILQYKLDYDEYPSSISDLVNVGLLSEDQTHCSNGNSIGIYDGQAAVQ